MRPSVPTAPPSIGRAVRLRGVLDHRDAVPRGDRQDRVHVGRLPVEMHRHDRLRRAA